MDQQTAALVWRTSASERNKRLVIIPAGRTEEGTQEGNNERVKNEVIVTVTPDSEQMCV